jgi:hypothetical protein
MRSKSCEACKERCAGCSRATNPARQAFITPTGMRQHQAGAVLRRDWSAEEGGVAGSYSMQKAEQQARFRRIAQDLAAQGCRRCRGSKVQVEEPPAITYDTRYEASCLDCGEMWWAG